MFIEEYIHMHKHFCALEETVGTYNGAIDQDKKFKFANIIWQVIEDKLDGQGSMLDYIIYSNQEDTSNQFNESATVKLQRIKKEKSNVSWSYWVLKDIKDEHVWLVIGTDFSLCKFPKVIFKHYPKKS